MGTKIERENMKKKVLLGMSGGVDSSVSAIILQEQGYEVIGVTLNLFSCASCCSYIDVKSVCNTLGIPHFIIEGKDVFQKYVINDFINCYKKCTTPNPCIECNKYMKFGLMYEKAKELGCDYIATGHYAKTEYSEKYGRWVLKKSQAGKKDQSYVLWNIPKELIEHVLFPLADFENKEQIREIARENNLKNINIELPKNKLIVMTGVSGSGKSSLAFDTIFAEGQRRYVESLSAYARQFIGGTEKPDVDSIEGLSPSISIDQKSTNKNPRSTVGTITEIYDYLRLLFSKIGVPICPNHNIPIKNQSIEEMTNKLLLLDENSKIVVLSPIVEGKKGSFTDLLENFRKQGYVRAYIDDVMYDLSDDVILDKNL